MNILKVRTEIPDGISDSLIPSEIFTEKETIEDSQYDFVRISNDTYFYLEIKVDLFLAIADILKGEKSKMKYDMVDF